MVQKGVLIQSLVVDGITPWMECFDRLGCSMQETVSLSKDYPLVQLEEEWILSSAVPLGDWEAQRPMVDMILTHVWQISDFEPAKLVALQEGSWLAREAWSGFYLLQTGRQQEAEPGQLGRVV